MLNYLFNFFTGYMNIEIEGYYIEKFINTCKNKSIFLWGIKRNRVTILKAKIGISNFEQAKEIAKNNQCIIIVKSEKGMPYLIERYKKRKAFVISIFILLAIIFISSRFIWNIQVDGTKKINSDEIIKEAERNGLKIGVLKNKINTENLINKFRIERTDIAWVGIEIKGTNAIIKIVEAEEKPEIINESDYCNIIASKSGVISKIYAQNGTALVKEGDEVKKGDILIGGWMEGNFTEKNYVNGSGVVKARVKYMESKKIDKKEIKREQSGKKENKISIKFNNFKINFYKRLSKFEKYDTIYTEKKLQLFPNYYLPISFIKNTNYEVYEIENENDYEGAKQKGENDIQTKMNGLISGEIIDKTTDVIEYGSYYKITITYEVIEEIGTKEKFNI